MLVTSVHAIELIEYLLHVLLLDALPRIANAQVQLLAIVPRVDIDVEWFVLLTILHGIIHQVGDGILEVYLIDKDGRFDSFYLRVNLTTGMFHTKVERLGYILHHLVQVEFLLLEHDALLVEHRHLQHLLYKETQTLRLVGNHAAQMLRHLFRLGYRVVVHHLCSQRDRGNRCLQLVRHVVDKVVLDFRVTLLTENDHDGKQERNQQHDGEDDAGNHETHRREDVRVHLRKVDAHNTHLRLRVVAEQYLTIGIFLTFLFKVRTAIHLSSVSRRYRKVIRDVDAVVGQLFTNIVVEHTEVDALLQRLLAGSIENVVNHLVQQRTLIDITVTDNLLHGLCRISQRTLILAEYHGLGHRCRLHLEGLQLERRIDRTVVGSNGKLVALLDAAQSVRVYRVLRKGTTLRLVDIFFQIAQGLVHLQITRGLI